MEAPPIPGDLLLDIFRRIHDPADLVRTSVACISFRRLIANSSFLRQYRKLHAPPLLGFLDTRKDFQPAEPPYPSASAASAVALAADFSLSFVPAPACDWVVEDIRDGRVLLGRSYLKFGSTVKLMEMLVCDPLHRQYLQLPPIPDEMYRGIWMPRHTFLVPQPEEAAEETSFRVIWMARRGDKLVALVFSSTTGQWQAGPSHSWSNSFEGLLSLPGAITFSRPYFAYGCFYWMTDCREKLLVLDTTRMEFSIADAPPQAIDSGPLNVAIVEAGEGRPGMFVLPHDTYDLSFIIRRNNGGSSVRWQLEKTISLGFPYSFAGSTGRHLFLEYSGDFYSLDVKTYQIEMVCASKTNHSMFWPRVYTNFPPSLLSSPTVASGTEKQNLEQGGAAAQVHSRHGEISADVSAGAWRSG
uniref:Uncharacterized protein n=1 Tax=Avena sativa TaxID=4498 RepID=A0ACD5Z8C1_AVESA